MNMNQELLDILSIEKQKETKRERQLQKLDDKDPRKKDLSDIFGRERAKASLMIERKNEELERKAEEI